MKKPTWEEFCDEIKKEYIVYEFSYQDVFIYISVEPYGHKSSHKIWTLVIHKHDNKGEIASFVYESAADLIEKSMILGHKLQEIWNDIVMS